MAYRLILGGENHFFDTLFDIEKKHPFCLTDSGRALEGWGSKFFQKLVSGGKLEQESVRFAQAICAGDLRSAGDIHCRIACVGMASVGRSKLCLVG